jgi:YD repeat-containing protein
LDQRQPTDRLKPSPGGQPPKKRQADNKPRGTEDTLKEIEPMKWFSRRAFLGAIMAALMGWLRGKTAEAAPRAVPRPVQEPAYPTDRIASYTYDASGRLVSASQRGALTTISYDGRGRYLGSEPPSQ